MLVSVSFGHLVDQDGVQQNFHRQSLQLGMSNQLGKFSMMSALTDYCWQPKEILLEAFNNKYQLNRSLCFVYQFGFRLSQYVQKFDEMVFLHYL